jgi:hypothetical protein
MVLIGPPSPPGGVSPLSLVKRIRIPTHTSHDARRAMRPSKVPPLDHLASEAVGTNWLREKLWRARGDLNPGLLRAFRTHSTAGSAVRLGGSASPRGLSAALSIFRLVGVNLRDCATGPSDETSLSASI